MNDQFHEVDFTPFEHHEALQSPWGAHLAQQERGQAAAPQAPVAPTTPADYNRHPLGHLRLANPPEQRRDAIATALRELASRPGFNKLLGTSGASAHPLATNLLITGTPGSGRRHTARQYANALLAYNPGSHKGLKLIDGAALSPASLEDFRGSILCVTNLDALTESEHLRDVVTYLEQQPTQFTIVFTGTVSEASRLLDRAHTLSRVIALEIPLPDLTPQDLLGIFTGRITDNGRRLTSNASAAALEYFADTPNLNAHDAIHLADSAVSNQYRRLMSDRGDDFNFEARLVRWADVVGSLPSKSKGSSLDGLIGLEAVKAQIDGMVLQAKHNARRRQAGLTEVHPSRHMAFVGNPGTGKTEVARMTARILYEQGVISRAEARVCGREDLIAPHIGGTAMRTRETIESARGGVLFIDEAYTLIPSSERDFAHEALAALIQGMEDYREDLIVILAGYPAQMQRLMQTNPGLASRIATTVHFPDYDELELLAIFESMVAAHGFTLGPGIPETILGMAGQAKHDPNFGNARWARRLFEAATMAQSVRLTSDPSADMSQLLIDDLQPHR